LSVAPSLQIERLAREADPELLALDGMGADTAAALLIAAGGHPDRLCSEAAFAHLYGAAPVAPSSGKVLRHHLNPAPAATATPTGRCTWWRVTDYGATGAPASVCGWARR
jgi:hypothetical protein